MLRLLITYLIFFCSLGVGPLFAQSEAEATDDYSETYLPETYEYYNQETLPREEYYNHAQQQRNFSNDRWREVTEGINYTESVRKERQEDENFFDDNENKRRSTERTRSYDTSTGSSSAFWAILLKFLLIAAAIITLGIIIARFLGPDGLGKPRSRKISANDLAINLEEIEENIHESDLDRFIRQAIEAGNFNLAIRLYYLSVIKELSLSNAIRWKRDKTNRDYLRELSNQPFVSEFRELTVIFERVWYGNHLLNEQDFNQLRPRFEQLVETARRIPKAVV